MFPSPVRYLTLLVPVKKSMGFPVNDCFYNVMQYLFSSGALKQIKIGLWDADNTTLALKCQKGVQRSLNVYFCDILINIGGERPSVQQFFCTPKFHF